jgi:hypothetical protein
MNIGPGPHTPTWRDPTAASVVLPAGPVWQSGPPRVPYRPRWRRLALVAAAGLAALAAVTWVVLWVRPPAPARLVVFQAGYDANLAVPPNPYGKAAARDLAGLAAPGSWFGTRARLHGSPEPVRLTRPGQSTLFPELDSGREKCVVVVLAAHGGRDRDGAFLFPDDATPNPAHRLRVKAVIDRLAQLPAARQKLLILDATQYTAFPDLGLVHNDFASAVEELHDVVEKVPNLVVFTSSGPDQRSWASPEGGKTSFAHFVHAGLSGGADADRDRRVTGWELIQYVRPRVTAWARDHRAALQEPVVLPRGDEGERRANAMHLVMADAAPPPAPLTLFEPPAELRQAWEEYRDLGRATPPPQAYTPHLWRQYEAWVLRYEQHLTAGDADGARVAREKATGLRRQIEDDRRLAVRPQTLALPAGVGSVPHFAKVPDPFRNGIATLADPTLTGPQRAKEWERVRALPTGYDPETARVLWGDALVQYVAEDPLGRLPAVPGLLPLIEAGFAVRPAELHFLAMLAAHLPPPDRATEIGPLLKQVLTLRLQAETAAACVPDQGYPYAEVCQRWVLDEIRTGDAARRPGEDLCFATDRVSLGGGAADRLAAARGHYAAAANGAGLVREVVTAWHAGAARLPGFAEWVARDAPAGGVHDQLAGREQFLAVLESWGFVHGLARVRTAPPTPGLAAVTVLGTPAGKVRRQVADLDIRLAGQVKALLDVRPEFEGQVTPRADAVRWWHAADAVLTAPPAGDDFPARRVDLLREHRRVSRQLLVTGQTRPEALPAVTPEVTRERAFDAARRRGLFLLARIGRAEFDRLAAKAPGDGFAQAEFRLNEFAFPAAGRQSLAEVGTRLGEILAAVGTGAGDPAEADRLLRLATPAGAAEATGRPAAQLRRSATRELLAAQARRTLEDHWYDGRGNPYYRPAIDQLAADAEKVFPRAAKTPDEFAALKGAAEDFPVQPALPARVAVTDEPYPIAEVPLPARAGVSGRPGFAVVWAEPPFPPAEKTDAPAPRPERVPVATATGGPVVTLAPPVARPAVLPTTPVPVSGQLKVNGFYRGRFLNEAAPVDVYAVPHQAAVTTPPTDPYAKLAVRSDPALGLKFGLGSGSVAIVLDCSGSMRPDPAVRGHRGLYPVAVEALRDVLAELPPGTVVSVRTFGRRTPGAATADDTIEVLVPPAALPLARATAVDDIVRRAAGIAVNDLYDRSPVVRAVLAAKDALKTAPGPFKAVVLISDAVDTRFADDPAFATPKRSIKDVVRAEFPAAGVPLAVVALPVQDPVEVAAQKQFELVTTLRPAGKFVPPADAKKIGEWLRTGLNPRLRYSVEAVDSDSPVTPFDLTAATEAPDNWYAGSLPRGRYRVKVVGDLGFRHDVFLGPGDRLLLDLSEEGGAFTLKRHWFADTWPAVARSGGDARKLALLQNRLDGGQLRMVASIEDRPAAAEVVTVARPGEAWFEVGPAVPKAAPVAVRWRAVPGYPAPTWAVDAGGWPVVPGGKGAAAPLVKAWWHPDTPVPRTGAAWVPPPGLKLLSLRNEPLPLDDAKLTLHAVTVETHAVEVRPGVLEKRPCLVARLSHPPGRVAWVRPTGIAPLGSEARFYRDANKVTCLFWWADVTLPDESAAARVTGFEVVALATAKAEAPLELTAVPAPSENGPIADPPAGTR